MAQQSLLKRPTINDEGILETTASTSPSSAHEQQDHTYQARPTTQEKSRHENSKRRRPATEHLQRQGYIIYLVLIYAAMLCTAWSILIVTSKHPIGRSTYGCFNAKNYCDQLSDQLTFQNERTVRYISNAQTLLSAVSLLTIPLTSAVCAAAVVPWLQQSGQGMSLRQVMTLSDKGWTSPYIYYRLLLPTGWKRYGSSFVALALLLHALGASLSPAINKMSALIAVKVPRSSYAPRVYIMPLQELLGGNVDDRLAVLSLRDALKTVNAKQIRPQIWVPKNINCDTKDVHLPGEYDLPNSTQCTDGGMTYLSLTTEPDAWVSQLISGFTTGVKTSQYIPRVSTSVEVELLNGLPVECNSVDAALMIEYAGDTTFGTDQVTRDFDWSIKVCIPEYGAQPFNDTDDAQNLIETVYLDLYTYKSMDNHYHNVSKITMSTTVGYFELPNYNNGNLPGTLLENYTSPTRHLKHRRQTDQSYHFSLEKNFAQQGAYLEIMRNQGPLLKIIFALFGNGSMPAVYLTENATYNPGAPKYGLGVFPCLDIVPLTMLVEAYSPYNGSNVDARDACLNYLDLEQGSQMHNFLSNFFIPTQALERVFRAAAYVNHEIWLRGNTILLDVEHDAGQDLQKPGLGNRSIIALTIAIAVFLLSLLMLAFYASFSKTWTYSLDAHALLRIGAELGREALPFLVIRDAHHIGELDELPGWVGDVTGDDETKERQLGMEWNGLIWKQVKPVKKDGLYQSYPNMQQRDAFQVFCLWCNTICGLGGLRRTSASVKIQRLRALTSGKDGKIGILLRQTRIGKWWSGDYLVYTEPNDQSSAYRGTDHHSAA